jgi:hypothetical protein
MIFLKEKISGNVVDRARKSVAMGQQTMAGLQDYSSDAENRQADALAGRQREAHMVLASPAQSTRYVMRLDALTSDEPPEVRRQQWFVDVQESLEATLTEEEKAITRIELENLAALHRPEFLATVEHLARMRSEMLTKLWDLVYLLRRLGGSAEVSASWLCQRIRVFLDAHNKVSGQEREILSEIMWCDLGGEG